MKVCSVDGCGKAHRARGLCSSHYNQQYQPNRHAKVTVQCTYCGSDCMKGPGKRKGYRPYCDYTCRDLDRCGSLKVRLPRDHPVMVLIRANLDALRPSMFVDTKSKVRFVVGTCPCGTPFVGDRHSGYSSGLYCSATCCKRFSRRERRDKERGRKIHWTQVAMRDGMACHICGDACDPEDFTREGSTFTAGITFPTVDHVVALANGGAHDLDNARLAHMLCNSLKGATYHAA